MVRFNYSQEIERAMFSSYAELALMLEEYSRIQEEQWSYIQELETNNSDIGKINLEMMVLSDIVNVISYINDCLSEVVS
jgi:hypothetical protein